MRMSPAKERQLRHTAAKFGYRFSYIRDECRLTYQKGTYRRRTVEAFRGSAEACEGFLAEMAASVERVLAEKRAA
jgi:hypothetical protein